MSTATASVTAPASVTPPAPIIEELRAAWQEYQTVEKRGLAFGQRLYELRAGSEVVQGGTTFSSSLDKARIPRRTAYYWIDSYEISIEERQKPQVAPAPATQDVEPATESTICELLTLEPAEQPQKSVKPIVFPAANPERISDHTARLTELSLHFAGLNPIAKRIRTEALDAPAVAEVLTLITSLRKISKDADEKATLIETALKTAQETA
jgi:hypothetical protein